MATKEEKITMLKSRIAARADQQEKNYGEIADRYLDLVRIAHPDLGSEGEKFVRGAFMDGLSFNEI